MDESLRYPIGQQDFRELREMNSLYVDKTSYIEKIAL
ncbi:MAG: AAA family ATPase, partial [Muribaculaceae bacterium]|nr:AAA family ATPase [Muribaculaceae bacterium]